MLLDTVRNTIQTHNLIEKGDKVVCAVSGGADSVCLLHALLNLRSEYQLTIYAANVNHLIRGEESDYDSDFVKRICKAADVELFYREYDVPKLSKELKMGTEECARMVRYEFFEEISKNLEGAKIATAHNLNDNAETVLFRLIRGSSAEGLCGINHRRGNIIRPLLEVPRKDIEKYLRENNISYVTDSSNLTPDYSRNKLRLNVFPELRELFPDAEKKIVNASRFIKEDNDYLNSLATEFENEFSEDGYFIADKFNTLPACVKRRVAHSFLQKWGASDISSQNIEDFINLAKNESGKEFDINGVFYAVKVYDKVVLQRRKEKEEFVRKIKAGETLETEDWKITVKTVSQYVKKTSNNIAVFDAGLLKGPFTVRYRKDGDKMVPLGLDGRKKLSDIFSDAKIESIKRNFIPLVEFNGEILYLCGLRQSSHFKADKYTKDYLIIEYYYKGMRKNEC